jgi:hypothetical protein
MTISKKEFFDAIESGSTETVFDFIFQPTPQRITVAEGKLAVAMATRSNHAEIFILCLSLLRSHDIKDWIYRHKIIENLFREQAAQFHWFYCSIISSTHAKGIETIGVGYSRYLTMHFDSDGDTILIWAAKNGYYYLTKYLLSLNSMNDVECPNIEGETILSIAQANQSAWLIDLLTQHRRGELPPLHSSLDISSDQGEYGIIPQRFFNPNNPSPNFLVKSAIISSAPMRFFNPNKPKSNFLVKAANFTSGLF